MDLGTFLHRRGKECQIYEARSLSENGGVGFGLAPNGMRVLRELGLDKNVRAAGSTYVGMKFSRADGRVLTIYNDQANVVDHGVAVSRQDLIRELRTAYIGPIQYDTRVDSIDADIIIAADGINSSFRSLVAPSIQPSFTGLVGLGGFIEGDLAPNDYMHMFFGSRGFFGVSGVGKNRSMWWSAIPVDQPLDIKKKHIEELRTILLDQHRGWAMPIEEIITRAPHIWADNLFDVSDLPTWHKGNICLMGDAAHAVSPHSGQGVSQALEDAWVLAEELSRSLDVAAFQRFEARRRTRVDRVIQYGRQSSASKKELGPLAVCLRNTFITLAMPSFARSTAKWMYKSPLDANG